MAERSVSVHPPNDSPDVQIDGSPRPEASAANAAQSSFQTCVRRRSPA